MNPGIGGGTVAQRAIRAVAWGYGGTVLRMVMQVGAQAVLARLLGPQEFGVFAALMLLASVAVLAADLVSAPIIQTPELSPEQLRFACACQLIGSVLVALLVMCCLPIYTGLFPMQPHLGLGLALMALGTLATGLSGVALSMLRRKLRYKEIQLTQLFGYFVGYVLVGIPLGLLGFNSFLVLVVAWLVQSLISSVLLFVYERHSLALSFDFKSHRSFLKFGAQISFGNISNWFSSSLDRVLVTKYGSPVDIGYYNTMLNLMMTPVVQLASSLNTVAFSVSAQASEQGRREGALAYLNLTALSFFMLYGVVASFPSSMVELIYGARWLGGSAYIEPFCMAAVGFAVGAAANAILTSTGKGAAVAYVQTGTAVAMFIAVLLSVKASVLAAAYWVAALYLLRALWLSALSLKHVGVAPSELLRLLGIPIVLVALQIFLAKTVHQYLGIAHPLVGLLIATLSALLVFAISVRWRERLFCPPSVRLLSSLLQRLIIKKNYQKA